MDTWHCAGWSTELGEPLRSVASSLGRHVVLFRDANGTAHALARAARTAGRPDDKSCRRRLHQCPFHDGASRSALVRVPSQPEGQERSRPGGARAFLSSQ